MSECTVELDALPASSEVTLVGALGADPVAKADEGAFVAAEPQGVERQ